CWGNECGAKKGSSLLLDVSEVSTRSLTNSLDTRNHLKIHTTFLSGQPGRPYTCINRKLVKWFRQGGMLLELCLVDPEKNSHFRLLLHDLMRLSIDIWIVSVDISAVGGDCESCIILAAVNKNEKKQLQRFSNACKGIPQIMQHAFPFNNQGPNVGPAAHTITAEDSAHLSATIPAATTGQKEKNGGDSLSCVICLNAPVEGAFIPCGHMAGCMSCLTEIKSKNSGCPICRANIDQVNFNIPRLKIVQEAD
nr:ankyrin repeat-containing protein [Tanacetum cinerariifolium]